jgi:DNA-binding cell septation regulator SpoVG
MGERNARLIREIIVLPRGLTIHDLKVMRGQKGMVVFEQTLKPSQHIHQ